MHTEFLICRFAFDSPEKILSKFHSQKFNSLPQTKIKYYGTTCRTNYVDFRLVYHTKMYTNLFTIQEENRNIV
jgi:hypothetical protein